VLGIGQKLLQTEEICMKYIRGFDNWRPPSSLEYIELMKSLFLIVINTSAGNVCLVPGLLNLVFMNRAHDGVDFD
jgi:hypothetical protein